MGTCTKEFEKALAGGVNVDTALIFLLRCQAMKGIVSYPTNVGVSCLAKRSDTVGELKSAEMGVSNMPSWKAKKLEKLA